MIFHMFVNTIATIFLSVQFVTTITFDEPVETFVHGETKTNLYAKLSKDRKILVLRPLSKELDSNLSVITKTNQYRFFIKYSEVNSHTFINIKDGILNNSFTVVEDNPKFRLLEGATSMLFINKEDQSKEVDGIEVKRKAVIPKGAPVILNGKRIYN